MSFKNEYVQLRRDLFNLKLKNAALIGQVNGLNRILETLNYKKRLSAPKEPTPQAEDQSAQLIAELKTLDGPGLTEYQELLYWCQHLEHELSKREEEY